MSFVDRDKILANTIAAAEKDVDDAVEKIRPDEKGKPAPGEANTPVVAPEVPPGDSESQTWKERYGNLQRHIEKNIKPGFQKKLDDQDRKINELTAKIEGMVSKSGPAELPQSDEELNELKKENPAAYAALTRLATTIAEEIVTSKTKDLQSSIKQIEQASKRNVEEAAFIELAKRHPNLDVFNLDADPKFVTWFQKQPKRIQEILTEQKEDVEAASSILSMFEATLPPVKRTDKKTVKEITKEAASEVEVSSAPNIPQPPAGYEFTESQIDEMDRVNPNWFNQNFEKIDKAIQEGRVLLDITDPVGTARKLAARGS